MNLMHRIFKYKHSLKNSSQFLNTENLILKNTTRNINGPSYKLQEIGVSKPINSLEHYGAGQAFIHRIFGYRGVLLFPWHVRYFDSSNKKEEKLKTNKKDSNLKTHSNKTYYQALMDNRDSPFIKTQYDGLTLLSHLGNMTWQNIGIDYVSSEDILPYTSTEKIPIENELFSKFLMQDSESNSGFIAREALKSWQERNVKWLEFSDVYSEISNNVRVTVIPFYIGMKEKEYWWKYLVRIENLDKQAVILRERQWKIFSNGKFEIVSGKGVVGREPCLNNEFPAFQYSSNVRLTYSSGNMWGVYRFEKEDGTTFDARIPNFNLDSRDDDNVEKPPFI